MAQCKDCIHGEVCDIFVHTRTLICNDKADKMCKMFKPTADVVPKSEAEELKAIIADHKANEERLEELYSNAKAEVARIFEEIDKATGEWGCYFITTSKTGYLTSDVHKTLAELKKKYREEKK